MTVLAVFDCMVFLQGAARPNGPAAACIGLVNDGKVALAVSQEIVAEIRDVLNRPKLRKKFPRLTPKLVDEFVTNIESKASVLDDVPAPYKFERDPKDAPYLNLAIATAAPYLVSRDKDLLDLMNDDQFRERYPALTILDPVAFLRAIGDLEKAAPPAEAD